MKSKTEPIEDIRLIRKMMEDSSRFLSLSGLSGISAGIIAIAGAAVVYFEVLRNIRLATDPLSYELPIDQMDIRWSISIIALLTLMLAVFVAWYFTWKKSRSKHGSFWTPSAKNMVFSLASVLGVGGLLSAILLVKGYLLLIPGITLTFYGLALLHSSKYSHRDINYLSWLQIAAGLIACSLPNLGLLLWTLGFGVLHIVYGTIMYFKYDKEK